jgi:hypothetical protein
MSKAFTLVVRLRLFPSWLGALRALLRVHVLARDRSRQLERGL